MLELLSKLKSDDLVAVWVITVLFGSLLLVFAISIVAQNVRRYYERQLVTSLILEMLEHGLSTEEITRVLSAADLHDQHDELSAWKQRLGSRLRQKLGRSGRPEPPSPSPKS
jgi:hypothetical protein